MFGVEDFLRLIFWFHWGGMLLLVGLGWLLVKKFAPKGHRWWIGILLSWIIMAIFIVPVILEIQRSKKAAAEYRARYQAAKAVFDEQCKQAGEKIYKTVDNVEGIMLLKVRPDWNSSEYNPMKDPMWPDAAMASEFTGMSYIALFLHEYARVFASANGYNFVDVLQNNGEVIRYRGDWRFSDRPFDEEPNPISLARYAITYENNVDPALRQHWVAGTTIRVLDRQTNELLAEKVIFAFEPGFGSTATARQPWVFEKVCPDAPEPKRHTILFANKILSPQKGN